MADTLLAANNLGRAIDSGWLWRGLELDLNDGEHIAVAGPTGSGKSLLLRCLSTLDDADEGTIRLDGRTVDEWDRPHYRSRVVYLHQRPALWEGTVESNIAAVFDLAAHREQRYDRSLAEHWLEAFERDAQFLDKRTAKLSGGEQQITALVRALCIEPSVMLLDEATASMDPATTRQTEELIHAWVTEQPGRAAAWTSHDPEQIARVAQRTVQLGDFAP